MAGLTILSSGPWGLSFGGGERGPQALRQNNNALYITQLLNINVKPDMKIEATSTHKACSQSWMSPVSCE